MSFQYYDPIMIILKELISVDRREYYNDRNKSAIDNFMKQNIVYSLKKNLFESSGNDKFHQKMIKIKFDDTKFVNH